VSLQLRRQTCHMNMRRSSKARNPRNAVENTELAEVIRQLSAASSRVEKKRIGNLAETRVSDMLRLGHQQTLEAVLDSFFEPEPDCYDALLEIVESCAESLIHTVDGKPWQIVLLTIPVLAWTRFAIPSGAITGQSRDRLTAATGAHILDPGVRFRMTPRLYAIDQLPQNHVETLQLAVAMTKALFSDRDIPVSRTAPETVPFLADTRYFLGVAAIEPDAPLFRWQAAGSSLATRQHAQQEWHEAIQPVLTELMPGCGSEPLLPQAYFSGNRLADQLIRPASIRAAVHFLIHTLSVEASELTVSIGAFGENDASSAEEFRLGFSVGQQRDVLYGVVWPLFGEEDASGDLSRHEIARQLRLARTAPAAEAVPGMQTMAEMMPPLMQIQHLLANEGITSIVQHDELFPMEFCEDCGGPLYPDPTGDLVHPEMPDEISDAPVHFH